MARRLILKCPAACCHISYILIQQMRRDRDLGDAVAMYPRDRQIKFLATSVSLCSTILRSFQAEEDPGKRLHLHVNQFPLFSSSTYSGEETEHTAYDWRCIVCGFKLLAAKIL